MNKKLQIFHRLCRLKFVFLIVSILVSGNHLAQIQNDFLNKNITRIQVKKYFNVENAKFHSAIQPYEFLDSSIAAVKEDLFLAPKRTLSLKKSQFNLEPILFTAVNSDGRGNIFTGIHAVGLRSKIKLHDKLHLSSSVLTGQSRNDDSFRTEIVPGVSRTSQNLEGLDFLNFNTALTYLPSDIFLLQIGKGKHKFGDGHRSLFLSDEAVNYPYAKIRTRVWNIEYINLFSAQKSFVDQNISPWNSIIPEPIYKDKFTSTHLLSWNVSPKVNFYFFETIIWQNEDTLSTRGFDVNYLNPIIFFRPVEFAVGSSDNAIVGLGSSWKINNKAQVYGQFVVDEMVVNEFASRTGWWANKYGAQLGFKIFDAFGSKDTYFQMEWNQVRPFTYSHGSPQQNYAHFNQPLAHPAGANFYEFLAIFVKDIKRYQFKSETYFLLQGRDIPAFDGEEYQNLGGDIFRSYENPFLVRGNVVGQGLTNNSLSSQLSAAYVFNQKNDGRFFINYNFSYLTYENLQNGISRLNGSSFSLGASLNFR